ncbi:hypothetical protein [Aureimonas pseudogalii]|uniref:PRC-barrel domain-containing protein n=1 Tax=Aureimonas pseudogalii TaxID=1744844 RepID=A0A7W6EC15_9HYPH|nr:hypothetical protein [Aureimonas pseudogalii]MBB3996477.1 hypothetical protein [Aureimonas pseudogalii]
MLAATGGPLRAQTAVQPAVPSITEESESLDSGVGNDETQGWIGKTVVSSDEREIGRLVAVQRSSDTSDGGILVMERKGRRLEVPLTGASADGDRVTVTPLFEAVVRR